jgi:hypothetical protein
MKQLFFVFTFLSAFYSQVMAQYYYTDIVSKNYTMHELDILKTKKVKNILIHSFEADGKDSKGFYCEKKLINNYTQIETYTKSSGGDKSLLTAHYNAVGYLIKTTDSSETFASTSLYEYDTEKRVSKITTIAHSADEDFNTTLNEVHTYVYDKSSTPNKMYKCKGGKDTIEIEFVKDANGNITDEIEKVVNGKHYYYYYNQTNRLTDIVKYHVVYKKLLPDFTFEYDEDGRLLQMITVDEGVGRNFFTWKYTYNEGLRIIEKCFSNDNKLLGYFEYEYE